VRRGAVAAYIAGVCLLTPSAFVTAQDGWDITLRPAVNFPVKEFGGSKLVMGVGLEGAFSYRFFTNFNLYIGYSWNGFFSDESFAGPKVSFQETGYSAGLQFIQPIGESDFSYFVGAGAILNHIEAENEAGSLIGDSKHGVGWQAGTGLMFPIANFMLVPSLRYRALSRKLPIDNSVYPVDLNYVSVGLGVTWAF
jgi:hypothetical protein